MEDFALTTDYTNCMYINHANLLKGSETSVEANQAIVKTVEMTR